MGLLSCRDQGNNSVFDLDGNSQISIINETHDSLHIKLENWYAVPLEAQSLDTLLPSASSLSFDLKMQGMNHYDLSLNKIQYRIFSQPNAIDTVFIKDSPSSDSILFLGDSKIINKFLLEKAIKFGSPDADWMPRARATHNAQDFTTIIRVNDSITQEHISYVKQHLKNIPEWYANFEIERLSYVDAQFKINSFFYRKAMLGKEESLPARFAEEINESVEVQNANMLGNMKYMYFLDDYIYFKTDSSSSLHKPESKKEWQDRYDSLFFTAGKELSDLPKDFHLASVISRIIDTRSYILDTNWIAQVSDTTIKNFLLRRVATHEILSEGKNIPYFYLLGSDDQHYEPVDFRNHILLINFWATWCKPCIKEFPDENSLVEKFESDPVTIVNICMDSDFGQWRKMVKKNKLKTLNLIAQGNWNDVLSEKFGVRGLPHSILIDWNGKVVKNKCPRASEGIENQIAKLLNKMKTESNNVHE